MALGGLLLAGGLGTAGLLLRRRRDRMRRLAADLAAAQAAAAAEAAMALDPMEEAIATVGQDIQIRISSLNALNELIDQRPDEALAVVRAWIEEGAPA